MCAIAFATDAAVKHRIEAAVRIPRFAELITFAVPDIGAFAGLSSDWRTRAGILLTGR
jgi:hypothetical protein